MADVPRTPRAVPPAGGRSRRVPGGRKHETKVLMNDAEFERVQAYAVARGVSIPRVMIEGVTVERNYTISDRWAFFREFLFLRRQVSIVAKHANQIARALNSGGDVDEREIRAMLERAAAVAARVEGLPDLQ